jgi:hypothetical protein
MPPAACARQRPQSAALPQDGSERLRQCGRAVAQRILRNVAAGVGERPKPETAENTGPPENQAGQRERCGRARHEQRQLLPLAVRLPGTPAANTPKNMPCCFMTNATPKSTPLAKSVHRAPEFPQAQQQPQPRQSRQHHEMSGVGLRAQHSGAYREQRVRGACRQPRGNREQPPPQQGKSAGWRRRSPAIDPHEWRQSSARTPP